MFLYCSKLCKFCLADSLIGRTIFKTLLVHIIWCKFLCRFFWSARLQNSCFFLKIRKEIGKAWRKSRTAAVSRRETHETLVLAVLFSFRPGGSKMSSSCQKIRSQLRPLCEFDKLGDCFRGRIARVMSARLESSNSKAVFSVASRPRVWE